MIDQELFRQRMALIADRIGRPLAGPTQVEYYRHLSAALTTEQFVAATTLVFHAKSAEYRNWPSPREIIELITPVAEPSLTAHEMFERVLALTAGNDVSQYEAGQRVQTLGAAAVRAFYAAGGRRDFRNVLEADVPWLRKRFVEAYEAACENADAERAATLALNDVDARVAALTTGLAVKLAAAPPKRLTEAGSR